VNSVTSILGKLELQVDNLREGISYFEKALKVLRISHGEKHELIGLLKHHLEEASREMSERTHLRHLENMKEEEE
jgi:hypothetical protein